MKPIDTNRVCKSLLLAFLMLFVPTLTIAVNAVSYRSNLGSKTDPTRSEGAVLKGPEDVIFVAPEGTVSTYYMDLRVHDPAVGYINEYHNKVKVTFCENGDVYMPNMLFRNSIKGLMKGKLNDAKDRITFQNKMIIGWGANKQKYYYLRACDASGVLSTKDEFTFVIDKTSGTISGEDGLYLALYFGDDVSEYYAIAGDFKYTPQENVDKQVDSYDFSYTKADDEGTVLNSKAKGYFEGRDFYVKGMNQKYPEAWMKGTLTDDSNVKFLSHQMAFVMKNDDPIVMIAVSKDATGKYTFQEGFELAYDQTAHTLKGLSGSDLIMANVYLNEDQTTNVYQVYNNLSLTLKPLKPATPKDPTFYGFSASDKEFTFVLPSEDVNGEALDTDFLTFRVFMDGKPYTFTKKSYPKLKSDEDLLDIPFAFHDYNTIYSSKFKRYIYFNDIPEGTETLGVEVKYEVKGVTNKSKQLVYNIKTNTSSYSGNEIENRAVFLFSAKSQAKASLHMEFVDPQQTVRIDWGEGNGIEDVTLDENGNVNHTFSKDVEGYHVVTVDVANVKRLSDGDDYEGTPIGVREVNAPQLTDFSITSALIATPDIDFSHLSKLEAVSFNAISSFVAPSSLVSFSLSRSTVAGAPYLTSIDLTRAKGLKKLQIYQASHMLKEIDLTQNKELTSLMISGSSNLSMKPTLTTIKGVKELKNLTYCDLQYNALDFCNLISNQPKAASQYVFQYDNQRFAIPEDKVGIAKVDLSYLYEISDGLIEGTHQSTYDWYLAPETEYDPLYYQVDPSYYEEQNGVFTFKPGAFGEGVQRAKIVCKISNDAYPSYSNSYSAPITVSLVDDNHCFYVIDGAYASYVEPSYEAYTEKEENGQWVFDKRIDNGDKVEPGTHVAVKAVWDYEMIIDNWTINGKVVTDPAAEDKPFRGATLRFVMPEEGSVEVVPNFTAIKVSWKIIAPDGVTDEELDKFAIHVTKTQNGKKEIVSGQRIGSLYGSDTNCADALFTFEASCPNGYKVDKWFVNGIKQESTDATLSYQTDPYEYQLKVEVKLQTEIKRYAVSLSADPSDYAQSTLLKIKNDSGAFEDLTTEFVYDGSTVRAYVKPIDVCKIDKFVVNGSDFQGSIVDAGADGQYIELSINKDTDIVAKMLHTHDVITFAPKGDNATAAKAEIIVTKQEKDDAGNWIDGESVKSGDHLAPGQRVKVLAKYDKRFIIKNWVVNGTTWTDSSAGGVAEVSYDNPIFLEMPSKGDLNIAVELERANMVCFLTVPEGVADGDKDKFSLTVSLDGKVLRGQEMSPGVKAYHVEGIEGKTFKCEAKAMSGYIPQWTVDGNKRSESDFAIDVTAKRNLTIRLEFVKDNAVEQISQEVSVYGGNGQITIVAPSLSHYTIYDVNGALMTQGSIGAYTSEQISVIRGIYVVVVNGVSYKISVDID